MNNHDSNHSHNHDHDHDKSSLPPTPPPADPGVLMAMAALADGRLTDAERAEVERCLAGEPALLEALIDVRACVAEADAGDSAPLGVIRRAAALVPATSVTLATSATSATSGRRKTVRSSSAWRFVRASCAAAACLVVGVTGYRIGLGSFAGPPAEFAGNSVELASDDLVDEMTFGVFGDEAVFDLDLALIAPTVSESAP
jgi:anti-sigma factor RsiW